jgi:small-conductance mechanosensitive channel/CRP-like cAMP-binding protein
MDNLYRLLIALLIVVSALALRGLSRKWRLPRPPFRTVIFAAVIWFIFHGIRYTGGVKHFNAVDEIVLSYAAIRYLLWLFVEIPPKYGLFKPLPNVLRDLLFWLVFGIALVVELKVHGGLDLTGLLTTSAVLTAVLGLALQEPLKDFFAGIEIQIDPPFRRGDWIELDGVGGVVDGMNLMDTKIRMVDNSLLSFPNGKITDERVRVFEVGEPVGNSFSVSLDYQLPPGQAIEFLKTTLRSNFKVLRDPAPRIWLGSYDDFSIRYDIIVFQEEVQMGARNSLKSDLLSQIWYALERQGRSFPYPVMELSRWQPLPVPNDPALLLQSDKLRHLKNGWLFRGLDDQQLESLVADVRFVRFGPGDIILNQGDEGSTLYQVIRGQVEVLVSSAGKPFVSVAMVGEDTILGEMSLLTDEPRSASLRAVGECMLLEVERRDLQPIFHADPELLEELAELVADRRAALEKLSSEQADTREQGILAMMRKLFA